MTNINLAMISNTTDEELIKICTFNKPESEFEPVDYLIVELTKRLEAAKEHKERSNTHGTTIKQKSNYRAYQH